MSSDKIFGSDIQSDAFWLGALSALDISGSLLSHSMKRRRPFISTSEFDSFTFGDIRSDVEILNQDVSIFEQDAELLSLK